MSTRIKGPRIRRGIFRTSLVSIGLCAGLANAPVHAMPMPWDNTLPAAGNPLTSQQYGDFTVYSFPYLNNLKAKGAFNALLNTTPGSGYEVDSQPGALHDQLVIVTGNMGAAADNTDVCGATGCDDAYDYVSSSETFFTTPTQAEPSPAVAGENFFYSSAWTAELGAVQSFLDGGAPVFLFNLNEDTGGDENTLDGQALLAALKVTLYGGTEAARSFYLGANTALPGMGAAVTAAKWASDGEPEMDETNTGMGDEALGSEGDELYDPMLVNAGNPNGFYSGDPRLAYVHGRICVDSTDGSFLGFGSCNFLGVNGDTINQNLGAEDVAFASFNQELADLIAGASTDYTKIDVSLWTGGQSNGFEQLFLAAADIPDDTVDMPEPGTLALFGLGLVGLGYARRRRAA